MIFSAPAQKTLDALHAGVSRLVVELNRFHPTVSRWPTFANDAAAAAGNLNVGDPYATPDGSLKRRVS